MKNLEIDKSVNTPHVSFDHEKGILLLRGRLIPEDPGKFFGQLTIWLEEYAKNPNEKTLFELQLEYLNSGASKSMINIFNILEDKVAARSDILVKWFYEDGDESMLEEGENFMALTCLPMELVKFNTDFFKFDN